MSVELQILRDYIRDVIGFDGEVDADTDLLERKVLDSFNVVEMALFIQSKFNVELEAEDLVRSNLARLSSMLDLIARKRGAPAATAATHGSAH